MSLKLEHDGAISYKIDDDYIKNLWPFNIAQSPLTNINIHMMCAASGKERTTEEYAELIKRAGWTHANTFHSHSGLMGVIQGNK